MPMLGERNSSWNQCCVTCLTENKENLSSVDASKNLLELIGEIPVIFEYVNAVYCSNCVFQLEKFNNFKSQALNSIKSLERLVSINKPITFESQRQEDFQIIKNESAEVTNYCEKINKLELKKVQPRRNPVRQKRNIVLTRELTTETQSEYQQHYEEEKRYFNAMNHDKYLRNKYKGRLVNNKQNVSKYAIAYTKEMEMEDSKLFEINDADLTEFFQMKTNLEDDAKLDDCTILGVEENSKPNAKAEKSDEIIKCPKVKFKPVKNEVPTKGKVTKCSVFMRQFKHILPDPKLKKTSNRKIIMELDRECTICDIADIENFRIHVYENHMIEKRNPKLYYCKECNLEFTRKESVFGHFDIHRYLDPPRKCPDCDDCLSNAKEFKRHVEAHKFSDKQYKCPACKNAYCRYSSVQFHYVNAHTDVFMCKYCQLVFELEEDYKEHMQAEKESRKEQERLIRYTRIRVARQKQKDQLKGAGIGEELESDKTDEDDPINKLPMVFARHTVKVNRTRKKQIREFNEVAKKQNPEIYCFVCEKYVKLFKEHVTQEHSKKLESGAFQCNLCDSILKDSYYVHFSHIHRQFEEPQQCPYCEFQSIMHETFRKHMMEHKRLLYHGQNQFVCHYCNAGYTMKSGLRYHLFDKHTDLMICKYCSKIFKDHDEYGRHFAEEKAKRRQKQLMCDICGFRTSHFTYIRDHMKRVHGDQNDAVACDICGKVCKSKLNLQDHRRNVHGAKNEVCPQCGKKFRTPAFLREHTKLVHSATFIQCTICNKQCTPVSLKRHMFMVHDSKRPFECKICHMTFKIKAGLQKHLHTHSGTRPFNCQICSQGFYHRELVAKHYKEVHEISYSREQIRQICKRVPSKFEDSQYVFS